MIFLVKRKIDLVKAMRTFQVVVEQQSFSAASRHLNLVTSAVSRQVSDLEKHFGCQLLYRTTRAMHLTAEGSYYLEQFKDVLARLDELETSAPERQQRIAGHIRITAPYNSGKLGLQHVLSDFLKRNPDVKLSWMLVNRYVNIIEEGFDLAIRVGELADSSLISRKVDEMKVLFVASPEFLAQYGQPSHPKELATLPCVLDGSNRQPQKWRYLENNKDHTVNVYPAIEVNQGELVAQFAASGHGIAQLPEFLVQRHIESGELQPILTEYSLAAIPISLVYPVNRLINPALKALIQYIVDNPLQK